MAPECQSYAIKNKSKAKDTNGKSLLNNDHSSVETSHVQSSDFIGKVNDEKTNEKSIQIEIKNVIATKVNQPTKFFEDNEKDKKSILESLKPPSSDNMVSSNISSVLYFDTLENISDNANYKVDHEGKPDIKAVIDIIKPDLPPLSEYDLESDSEDEQMMENVEKYFKTEDLNVSEITNSRVSAEASAQAKVISDNSSTTKSKKATIDITVEKVSLEVLGHGVDNKEATAVLPELRFVQSNVHQRQFLAHQISKDSDSTVKDIKPCDDSSKK